MIVGLHGVGFGSCPISETHLRCCPSEFYRGSFKGYSYERLGLERDYGVDLRQWLATALVAVPPQYFVKDRFHLACC
jgi:hypothetical protein